MGEEKHNMIEYGFNRPYLYLLIWIQSEIMICLVNYILIILLQMFQFRITFTKIRKNLTITSKF